MPLGSRIHAIVLHGQEVHVWIATASRDDDYSKWRGTFIKIEPDGRVTRVTVDEDVWDEEFVIREGDHQ